MSISVYLANAMLDHILGTAEFTPPEELYIGLYTGNPETNPETEISTIGTGYARVLKSFTDPGQSQYGYAYAVFDTNFGQALTDNGTVQYLGISDALTGGNLLFYDQTRIYGEVSGFDYNTGVVPIILDYKLKLSFSDVLPVSMAIKYLKHILGRELITMPGEIWFDVRSGVDVAGNLKQCDRKQITMSAAVDKQSSCTGDPIFFITLPGVGGSENKIKYFGLWDNETGLGADHCLFIDQLNPEVDYLEYAAFKLSSGDLTINFG